MSTDNPGNFFDHQSYDDDENADAWKPVKIHGNALFKKSIDILNITRTIGDLLADAEGGEDTARLMMDNAMIVPAKIKGAMSMDDVYSLVMERAVIIKVNITELKTQLWACEEIHGIEKKYIAVLKDEIEIFKQLFILWVTSFDKEKDLPDDWHLFNDPASFPADDEPFDADDFLKDFDPDT